MKKRKIFLCLTLSLLLLAGCGKDTGTVQELNNTNESGDNENTPDNADAGAAGEKDPEEELFSDTEEELEGMVQSVGESSVVISRIFSEESEEDGLYYVYSPGEGSDEEELITVSVTDDTKYRVRIIENGGEDATEKEGEFADIKKDLMIKVTGYMDDAGKEMRASEIVIMEIL